MVRLNKLLSQSGVASRRAADEFIAQGRVTVNGKTVTELGSKADPARDDVRVDGRRLRLEIERRYLLMNKPHGVLSSRSDPHRRKTVIDLLKLSGVTGDFYPVGRLDYDSEGLLLITNDGDFAEKVTHPRYEMERTYEALVEGIPDEKDLDRLRRGVPIEGRRTHPAEVRLLRVVGGRSGSQSVLELTLREGRNRQVRNMCDAIAHPVAELRRTRIAGISDRRLKPGQVRDLTPEEVEAILKPGRRETRKPEHRETAISANREAGKSEHRRTERVGSRRGGGSSHRDTRRSGSREGSTPAGRRTAGSGTRDVRRPRR